MHFISRFRSWQAQGLNEQYGEDRIDLFYAKALSNVLSSCSLVLMIFIIAFLFIDPALVALNQKFLNTAIDGTMVAIYGFAYFQVRRGRYELARNIFVASSVMVIVFSIMITGGFIESSVSSAIIVIPVLVYLFYGLRAGTIIAVLAPIALALQYAVAYFYEFQFPNLAVQNDPFIQSVLPPLVVYILLLCIVAGYEYRQSILQVELKAEREKLFALSKQDPLTGVANSRYFQEELNSAATSKRQADQKLALMFLDLDNFKQINDQHGHVIGDIVLNNVAQRLSDCARSSDLVGRVGGDEFAILLRGDLDIDTITKIRERLDRLFLIPIHHEGVTCRVGASVGIAVYPDEVSSPLDLIEQADKQMYAIKNARKQSVRLFSKEDLRLRKDIEKVTEANA